MTVVFSLFLMFTSTLSPLMAEEETEQPESIQETAVPEAEGIEAETVSENEENDGTEEDVQDIAENSETDETVIENENVPEEPAEELPVPEEQPEDESVPEEPVYEETEEPAAVYSDELFTYDTDDSAGTITISGYTGSDVFITIPSQLESMPGYTVTAIKKDAFKGSTLQSVTISDSVTAIGTNAFYNCKSLKEVKLPSGLTSLESGVFYGCTMLQNIDIPSGVESIGTNAFYNCKALTEVDLPSGLTKIYSGAFSGCTGITKLTIPKSVTSIMQNAYTALQEIEFENGMTSIPSSACYGASSLTKVTIPETVTAIGSNAFYGCKSLTEIRLPAGITSLEAGTFHGCEKLQNIDIPAGVTSIGTNAFNNCKALTEVDLPSGLTKIYGGAFSGCTGITKLMIPKSVTTIMQNAYTALQEIEFENGMTSLPSNACYGVSSLTKVTIPETVTAIGSNAFYGCKSLTEIRLPAGITSLEAGTFHGCEKLQNIDIPAGVASIGTNAFYNCKALTEVDLPSGLTKIYGGAFSGCVGITKLMIPKSVTSIISDAFPVLQEIEFESGMTSIPSSACSGSSSLTKAVIPDTVTEIGLSAFKNCKLLKDVDIPSSVKLIGKEAFSGCTSLEKAVIGDQAVLKDNVFAGCTSLKQLTIGNEVTLGNDIIKNCNALEMLEVGYDLTIDTSPFSGISITGSCNDNISYELDLDTGKMTLTGTGEVPDYGLDQPSPWSGFMTRIMVLEISDGITAIGNYNFAGARNMLAFDLPESMNRIGDHAFSGCSSLTYVEMNADVIGTGAFENCTALEEFIFLGDAPSSIGRSILSGAEIAKVCVPSAAVGWYPGLADNLDIMGFETYDDSIDSIAVTLVLDVSGSMRGKMDSLKLAARSFVSGIGGRVNHAFVGLETYNDTAVTHGNFSTVVPWVNYNISLLQSGGGTHYNEALESADSWLSNYPADKKVIVMFSDGLPEDGNDNYYAIADSLREKYTIFTVGLTDSGSAANVLKRIAGDQNHYFEAENIEGLVEAFAAVSKNLKREKETKVTITRKNEHYDLNTRQTFMTNSDEKITISVVPGYELGNYNRVALFQNGKEVLSNTEGLFENIMPAQVFSQSGLINILIFDYNNKTLEALELPIRISDYLTITYHMNDGTGRIFTTQTVRHGDTFSPPQDPVLENYTFKGWYRNAKCLDHEYRFFSSQKTEDTDYLDGDLNLYARWAEFNRLSDAWYFGNSKEVFVGEKNKNVGYEIRDGDKKKLEQSIGNVRNKNQLWEEIETDLNSKWHGSCFGMSSSAVLLFDNHLDIAAFQPDVYRVYDAEMLDAGGIDQPNKHGNSDVGAIESMINFYQKRWKIGKINDDELIARERTESENIRDIIQTMSHTKKPCVINLGFPYDYAGIIKMDDLSFPVDDEGSDYHSVVGYDFKQEDENTYSFFVYDPSINTKDFKVTLKKEGDQYVDNCGEWETIWLSSPAPDLSDRLSEVTYVGKYKEIFLVSATTPELLASSPLLVAPDTLSSVQAYGEEEISSNVRMTSNYNSFEINDGTHTARIICGKLYSGDIDFTYIGNMGTPQGPEEYEFVLPALSDEEYYMIKPYVVSESFTRLSYGTDDNGFSSSAELYSPGTMTFYADGSVQTSFDEAADQKISILAGNMNTKWFNVTMESKSKGISAVPSGDRVTVTSVDETVMTVRANSYFNSLVFEDVPVSAQKTEIIGNEDGLCTIVHDGETINTKDFGYSVIYDSCLGTQIPSLNNVPKGSLLEKPTDPKRTGYFFKGWYKDDEYTAKWNFETDTVQEDTVLYAGWSADPNYLITITFNMPDSEQQAMIVTRGTILSEDQCPVFEGKWYSDALCSEEWNFEKSFDRNTTLYANNWNQEPDQTLTISTDKAVLKQGETIQLTVSAASGNPVFTWMSGDESVAVVDSSGLVTAVGDGKTIITAATNDGRKITCTITVGYEDVYVKEIDSEYVYTGTAIKPVPAVYDSGKLLTAGKDYTVTYKNNTNAYTFDEDRSSFIPAKGDKTPYILITGKGNYSGKTYVPFSITQIDLNDPDRVYVEESITLKANGKVQRPIPVITFNGKTVSSKEYTLTYLDSDGMELDKKTGPKTAGTYTIVVTGNGKNFIGEREILLTIAEETAKAKTIALSKAVTVTTANAEYDGTAKETASFANKAGYELTEGTDYTAVYTKNVNAGTATVTATGKGIYTRTVKKTFKITPRLYEEHKNEFRFDVSDAVYSKGGAIPEVHVFWNDKELKAGTDYTLKYTNNKKAGIDGSVKITFKGNFKGSYEQPFKIAQKDIAAVNITAKDLVYKKGKYQSTPVLKDTDGKTLKAGVDYEKTYEYTGNIIDGDAQPDTEITVTVTGKGNYTGTVSATYHILETGRDISKATFKIANQEYTGNELEITDMSQFTETNGLKNAYITVNKQKEYLVLGEHFEVVPGSYVKNINKGTAKVSFRGINGYGGTKTVTFKIGQRSIQEYWKGIFSFFESMF